MRAKVEKIDQDTLVFDNGIILYSEHESDCCESHELSFSDLTLEDFEGLEFDLDDDNVIRKIEDYGIELVPVEGYSIKIPGYGHNNGYYSTNLTLRIEGLNFRKSFDISECQVITD